MAGEPVKRLRHRLGRWLLRDAAISITTSSGRESHDAPPRESITIHADRHARVLERVEDHLRDLAAGVAKVKGQTITVEIDGASIIRAVRRRPPDPPEEAA